MRFLLLICAIHRAGGGVFLEAAQRQNFEVQFSSAPLLPEVTYNRDPENFVNFALPANPIFDIGSHMNVSCVLPKETERVTSRDKAVAQRKKEALQHVIKGKLRIFTGRCLIYYVPGEYWAYRVCVNNAVEQFNRQANLRINLGHWASELDTYDEQEGVITQSYKSGQDGRSTILKFVCDDSPNPQPPVVHSIEEPLALQYSILIKTVSACPKNRFPSDAAHWQHLLQPLTHQCLNHTVGWWTYQYCHPSVVKQFHLNNMGKIEGPEYILGVGFDMEPQQNESKAIGPGVYTKATLGQFNQGPMSNVQAQYTPVASIDLVDGEFCEEAETNRSVRMVLVCPTLEQVPRGTHHADAYGDGPVIPAEIAQIQEPAVCKYSLVVRSPLLCASVRLLPKPQLTISKTSIQCHADTLGGERLPPPQSIVDLDEEDQATFEKVFPPASTIVQDYRDGMAGKTKSPITANTNKNKIKMTNVENQPEEIRGLPNENEGFIPAAGMSKQRPDSDSMLIDMVDEGKIGLREIVRSLHEVAFIADTGDVVAYQSASIKEFVSTLYTEATMDQMFNSVRIAEEKVYERQMNAVRLRGLGARARTLFAERYASLFADIAGIAASVLEPLKRIQLPTEKDDTKNRKNKNKNVDKNLQKDEEPKLDVSVAWFSPWFMGRVRYHERPSQKIHTNSISARTVLEKVKGCSSLHLKRVFGTVRVKRLERLLKRGTLSEVKFAKGSSNTVKLAVQAWQTIVLRKESSPLTRIPHTERTIFPIALTKEDEEHGRTYCPQLSAIEVEDLVVSWLGQCLHEFAMSNNNQYTLFKFFTEVEVADLLDNYTKHISVVLKALKQARRSGAMQRRLTIEMANTYSHTEPQVMEAANEFILESLQIEAQLFKIEGALSASNLNEFQKVLEGDLMGACKSARSAFTQVWQPAGHRIYRAYPSMESEASMMKLQSLLAKFCDNTELAKKSLKSVVSVSKVLNEMVDKVSANVNNMIFTKNNLKIPTSFRLQAGMVALLYKGTSTNSIFDTIANAELARMLTTRNLGADIHSFVLAVSRSITISDIVSQGEGKELTDWYSYNDDRSVLSAVLGYLPVSHPELGDVVTPQVGECSPTNNTIQVALTTSRLEVLFDEPVKSPTATIRSLTVFSMRQTLPSTSFDVAGSVSENGMHVVFYLNSFKNGNNVLLPETSYEVVVTGQSKRTGLAAKGTCKFSTKAKSEDWAFVPDRESPGLDLQHVGIAADSLYHENFAVSLEKLQKACLANDNCVAFTTTGWLKRGVRPWPQWTVMKPNTGSGAVDQLPVSAMSQGATFLKGKAVTDLELHGTAGVYTPAPDEQTDVSTNRNGYFASSLAPRFTRKGVEVPPQFRVGQIVEHSRWEWRGVVVGWDSYCRAPPSWQYKTDSYEPGGAGVYRNRRRAEMPHVLLLVDTTSRPGIQGQTAYVAENALRLVSVADTPPVEHPQLDRYFSQYQPSRALHIMKGWLRKVYPEDAAILGLPKEKPDPHKKPPPTHPR